MKCEASPSNALLFSSRLYIIKWRHPMTIRMRWRKTGTGNDITHTHTYIFPNLTKKNRRKAFVRKESAINSLETGSERAYSSEMIRHFGVCDFALLLFAFSTSTLVRFNIHCELWQLFRSMLWRSTLLPLCDGWQTGKFECSTHSLMETKIDLQTANGYN